MRQGRAVISALAQRNMRQLASLSDPVRGVHFALSPFVTERDPVLRGAALRDAWTDRRVRRWGVEDGSGAPIRTTFAQYFRRFVWDADFSRVELTWMDPNGHGGDSRSAIADLYPRASVLEAYVPPPDEDHEHDWRSLLLVFEPQEATWLLVGIVHDNWTI